MAVIDEIVVNDSVKLMIQTREYGKKKFIDIRKWVKTEKYEGFTKKGIAIEYDIIPKLVKSLEKVENLIRRKKL